MVIQGSFVYIRPIEDEDMETLHQLIYHKFRMQWMD
ncbi:hypothetical protein HNR44_003184 [Geomicrobium halophilum]|uniref:GNAT family N-acetyltransferase n=1 Tax=Geomicrobium halophilum TaxID=549000 RepID=A0A841PQX3_9BACL|nr:hypothetical protein [Geomicrobium halophilum]